MRGSWFRQTLRRVFSLRNRTVVDLVALIQRSYSTSRSNSADVNNGQHSHVLVCLLRNRLYGLILAEQQDRPCGHPERHSRRRGSYRRIIQPLHYSRWGLHHRSNGRGAFYVRIQQGAKLDTEQWTQSARFVRNQQPPWDARYIGIYCSLSVYVNSELCTLWRDWRVG